MRHSWQTTKALPGAEVVAATVSQRSGKQGPAGPSLGLFQLSALIYLPSLSCHLYEMQGACMACRLCLPGSSPSTSGC